MAFGHGKGPQNVAREARFLAARMRKHARRMRGSASGDLPVVQPTTEAGAEPKTSPPPPPVPAKFLLLEVPNFNNATSEAEAMSSYLRLGTVPNTAISGVFDAPKASGEDLAAHATFFLDDERKRHFMNGDGSQNGCPGFVSEAERRTETERLHTKGGWRDHSDGNRISTTRGDKVEVIRGNYKLIVLNRQDDPVGGVGWDVSGGHIEGVGASSSIEWVQTFDGTWRVVESLEKGDTITTQHGNSVSWSYGEIQNSTTGSEDETRPGTDENGETTSIFAPNPVITNRTWARKIESSTGSERTRVPLISDETWVDAMSTSTHAGVMSDETHVDGHFSTKTVAATMSDTTIANLVSTTVGTVTDTTVGNVMTVCAGALENLTVGALLNLTLAALLDINLTGSVAINLGHRTELDLASTSSLCPAKQEVGGTVTRTVGVESVVAGVYKVTAGVILLG